jgi:hypothetical protein
VVVATTFRESLDAGEAERGEDDAHAEATNPNTRREIKREIESILLNIIAALGRGYSSL